jgi:hypothetical protein
MGSKKIIKNKLTPQQELFCKLYATDREFFGNGVQSYIEAYDLDITNPKNYATAKTEASKFLSKPIIFNRISELLESAENGLNNANLDKQLLFVAQQNTDLSSKMRAIEHANKLKKRIDDKLAEVDLNLTIKWEE